MSTFSFLLSLTLLCLLFQPHLTVAGDSAVETATTKALIQSACSASGSPQVCYDVLNTVASNPYMDPTDITIVAVQAASKSALAIFDLFNASITGSSQIMADESVRQSFVLCAKEYANVLDLLDKSATALTQKVDEPQVPEYLASAISAIAKCDASTIKVANKAVQISSKNVDTTKLIKNALSVYEVFAEYIVNPSHDPSKSTTPTNSGGEAKTPTPNTGDIKLPIPNLGGNAGDTKSATPNTADMKLPMPNLGGNARDTKSATPNTADMKLPMPNLGGIKAPSVQGN